jgi:hypothetical protein
VRCEVLCANGFSVKSERATNRKDQIVSHR